MPWALYTGYTTLLRCAALVVSLCWLLVRLGNPVLQSRLTSGCDPVSGKPLASRSCYPLSSSFGGLMELRSRDELCLSQSICLVFSVLF